MANSTTNDEGKQSPPTLDLIRGKLVCHSCGKNGTQVGKLIIGHNNIITCNECIAASVEILKTASEDDR